MKVCCCISLYRKKKNSNIFNKSILQKLENDEHISNLASKVQVAKLMYDSEPSSENYLYYTHVINIYHAHIQNNLSTNYKINRDVS